MLRKKRKRSLLNMRTEESPGVLHTEERKTNPQSTSEREAILKAIAGHRENPVGRENLKSQTETEKEVEKMTEDNNGEKRENKIINMNVRTNLTSTVGVSSGRIPDEGRILKDRLSTDNK